MSDTPIRRTNWPTSNSGEIDDPLAELERIVGRNPKPAAAVTAPVQPTPAPAAFSPSATPAMPKAAPWPETPKASPSLSAPQASTPRKSDFLGISENDFEAAFRTLGEKPAPQTEKAVASLSAPVRQPFTSRLEPSLKNEQSFETDMQDSVTTKSSFENDFANNLSRGRNAEFESRADAFDFDTRATGTATAQTADTEENVYEEAEPAYYLENKQRSGLVTVIAVTGLVFVAVIGALIYSWVGSNTNGEPVVIKAETTPVKTVAKVDEAAPNSNKLIYDRLGSAGEETNQEKLVSREEQPVETLNPSETSAQNPRVVLPNPVTQDNAGLNAPRQVTTTTIRVKPDGTLESLPSSSDNTASTALVTPQAKAPVVATETLPRTISPAVKQAVANPVETEEAPPQVTDDETAAAIEEPVTPPAQKSAAAKPQRVANLQPAETPRPAAATAVKTAPTSSGLGFVVQISSQRSDAAARTSFTAMQQRFPQVLGSYQASIKPVALGDKGTYYRVRVGPLASRDDATALCGRLKAAGGDCVVTAN